MDEIRFYFSFRSPYAWLAFLQVPEALAGLPVAVKTIPVFPPPNFANDPTAVPAKLSYVIQHDLPRLTGCYGLPLAPPAQLDVDWLGPHAMWVYADDQGKGQEFGRALFGARFSESRDLADEATYRDLASQVGLDAEGLLAAAQDPKFQERVLTGMLGGLQDGIFGVPYFAYRDERFFGHDRIPWVIRSIRRDHGLPQEQPMRWL